MNVNELIEKLSALPEEYRNKVVWIEGCDCSGKACDVIIDDMNDVMITRQD